MFSDTDRPWHDSKYAHLRVIVLLHPSGTLAEVPALEAALVKRDDMKVPMSGVSWRWSEKEKFPPLAQVKKSPLWSADKYEQVRNRLRQPIPMPTVLLGGKFVTLDLHAPKPGTQSEESGVQQSHPP